MKNKKFIIILTVAAVILLLIAAAVMFKSKNDASTAKTRNLDQKTIDHLKNDVGKGSAGNVTAVTQKTDPDGNRIYVYAFKDGTERTITVRPAEEEEQGSGVRAQDSRLREQKSDAGEQASGDEEKTTEPEPPGTVYEEYMVMSSAAQAAFYKSFDDADDFYKWYDAAKAEYGRLYPEIVVGEGEVVEFTNKN